MGNKWAGVGSLTLLDGLVGCSHERRKDRDLFPLWDVFASGPPEGQQGTDVAEGFAGGQRATS